MRSYSCRSWSVSVADVGMEEKMVEMTWRERVRVMKEMGRGWKARARQGALFGRRRESEWKYWFNSQGASRLRERAQLDGGEAQLGAASRSL